MKKVPLGTETPRKGRHGGYPLGRSQLLRSRFLRNVLVTNKSRSAPVTKVSFKW